MERQITPGVKRKVKALRKKYCEGLVSDYYMETGIPRVMNEMMAKSDIDIKRLSKENDKKVREAIKNAKKTSGRRTKAEDKIIYI